MIFFLMFRLNAFKLIKIYIYIFFDIIKYNFILFFRLFQKIVCNEFETSYKDIYYIFNF